MKAVEVEFVVLFNVNLIAWFSGGIMTRCAESVGERREK